MPGGPYYLSASFSLNTNQLNISTNSDQTGFKIFPDFELEKMQLEKKRLLLLPIKSLIIQFTNECEPEAR